jgi:hypothetical protein
MKTDTPPLPDRVPTKRAQLGRLADVHIATWLAGDTITEAERDLLQREKDRRRQGRRVSVVFGVLAPLEGLTPLQRKAVREWQDALAPLVLLGFGDDWRKTVKEATHVMACPRGSTVPADMADAMKIARRRNATVRVVLPDGREA